MQLLDNLPSTGRVLFVWHTHHSPDDIKQFVEKLSSKSTITIQVENIERLVLCKQNFIQDIDSLW